MEQQLIDFLLAKLNEFVFITKEDSETNLEKDLNPEIKDLGGTIIIDGEWDKSDFEGIISDLIKEYEVNYRDQEDDDDNQEK